MPQQLTLAAQRARIQSAICCQAMLDLAACLHACYSPDGRSIAQLAPDYLVLMKLNVSDPGHMGKWMNIKRLATLTGFDRTTVRRVCRDAVKHGVLEANGPQGPYRLTDAYVECLVENEHHQRMVHCFITAADKLRALKL